ncbi:LtfC-like domain-containing protein [Nocardia pseudobrasiliensis]|uniref:LtfC/p132/Gp6 beta-sandwich domain-containing protein n=1 Tax=Nocardia pseudobrasiliensis TaxID=45979 RepID=A0A370HZ48_9NOCA|nr:hypothetical protein [Nocardia pseudobrasiliensis]RDI63231.1 hypothetical protein DFR76_111250 [Nocardia pseudobrasiliensis]
MTTPSDPGFLGYQPTIEPLKLTTGASFVQTVQPSGGAVFPSGTTISLVLTAPGGAALGSWPATVTSTTATWNVSTEIADAVPANSRYTMLVTYPAGPAGPATTYAWYAGTVIRT